MLFSHSALVAPCLFHARLCLSSLLVSFLALLSNFATQLSVADRAHYINKMTWQPINVAPHVRSLSCATLLLPHCLPSSAARLSLTVSSSSMPNGQFVVVIRRILCIFIVIIARTAFMLLLLLLSLSSSLLLVPSFSICMHINFVASADP